MIYQKTLKNVISAKGVGIHTGEKVQLTIRPAPPDTGIVFFRVDQDPTLPIKASVTNVVDTTLATTLGAGDLQISTVEHLMAAFAGLAVDNAFVDVSAPELPIMDGSAAPFVFLLQSAGLESSNTPRRYLRVKKQVAIDLDGGIHASVRPFDGFRVAYRLEYDHPVFRQHPDEAVIDVNESTFIREVSRARTFGLLKDYEVMRSRNLVRGGSLDNSVVVDDYRVLNREGLRQQDEFVKHKLLDALGDLYLLGHPLVGSFYGFKSGHGPNNRLLHKLIEMPGALELVSSDELDGLQGGLETEPLLPVKPALI